MKQKTNKELYICRVSYVEDFCYNFGFYVKGDVRNYKLFTIIVTAIQTNEHIYTSLLYIHLIRGKLEYNKLTTLD